MKRRSGLEKADQEKGRERMQHSRGAEEKDEMQQEPSAAHRWHPPPSPASRTWTLHL